MNRSIFTPIFSVYDDGSITVDWSSSYDHTIVNEEHDDYSDPSGHCQLMDAIIGEPDPNDPAAELRRLITHMGRLTRSISDAEWDHLPAPVRAALDPGSVES